jgi:hypothetical protein
MNSKLENPKIRNKSKCSKIGNFQTGYFELLFWIFVGFGFISLSLFRISIFEFRILFQWRAWRDKFIFVIPSITSADDETSRRLPIA